MNLSEMATKARNAFYDLSVAPVELRNQAMITIAKALEAEKESIFQANEADLAEAEKERLAAPLMHRLRFDEAKLRQVQAGLLALSKLADPIGKTIFCHEITEGLKLYRVSCPIGVIGIIFESRPDALVQIASLAIKSGNSALLKGGREALKTNQALIRAIHSALHEAGLPEDAAQLMETREDVAAMLKEDEKIDLIIPRGSNAFVRYIMDHTRIPVMGHADGLCHIYVDKAADQEKALRIIVDAKTQYTAACNATETLLVHRSIADVFLPVIAEVFNSLFASENFSSGHYSIDDLLVTSTSADVSVLCEPVADLFSRRIRILFQELIC